MDPSFDFGALFQQFDTFLMGRRTFETARQVGAAAMTESKSLPTGTVLLTYGVTK
jgi:hypothetical protein